MKKIISTIALALVVTLSVSAQDTKGKTKEEIEACKKACEKDGKKCTAEENKTCTLDKKECKKDGKSCEAHGKKEEKKSKKACCAHDDKKA